MNRLYIFSLIFFAILVSGCSSKSEVEPNEKVPDSEVSKTIEVEEKDNLSQNDMNITLESNGDNNISNDINLTNDLIVDNNLSNEETKEGYTPFEKKFENHIAFNHYNKAIELLYERKYQEAYAQAQGAKKIYDNRVNNDDIKLPYISGFIREGAFAPRRIYYRIIKDEEYELKRLIRKIKLLSPPIALVILKKTSTYIDVSIQNVGDTPLDEFEVLVNDEVVKVFDQIVPKDTKVYRYDLAPKIETISFKEAYGFAPKDIEIGD